MSVLALPTRLPSPGALAEREFRLLFLGQAVSVVGDGIAPMAMTFAVLGLTGSATAVGLVLAAGTLPLALFVLVGGVIADRVPRRHLMLGSDVVRGLVQAVVAVLLATGSARLWELVVLSALYGAAEAFFRPAMTGLIPQTVSAPRLQQANALLGVSSSLGFVAGPAAAGLLVYAAGAGSAIAVDAATFAVSACFLLMMHPKAPAGAPSADERRSFARDLADGWFEVRSRTWLWAIILSVSLAMLLEVGPAMVLGPVVATRSLGGPAAWAVIATAFGAGGVLGGLVALRARPRRPLLVCCMLFATMIPLNALLALAAPVWLIAGWNLVAGAAVGFFLAVWDTTLQQQVPAAALSRVSSYDWMGSLVLLPLGYALAGPVSSLIGVPQTLLLGSAFELVSTAVLLCVPSIRSLRRVEPVAPQKVERATRVPVAA